MGYTHAGGVDRPLVAYKTAGGNVGAVVVPHMNWRGLFSRGTNAAGGTSTTPVEWPGFRTTASHSMGETQATTTNWMGSLLEGQRDAGGQMYMRNRYYDPATGQFTQTDPIGIAGGLNTYGFAAGDPVSYADPYGLKASGGDPDKEKIRRAKENRVEVFFWAPVGNQPSSQFGHVSVAVGDQNYSLGPHGFDTRRPSATDYIARQQEARAGGGIGLTLNLTQAQVAQVRASLSTHSADYNALANNCTDPIESALNALGFELGANVFPNELKQAIRGTGLVQEETYYAPTTTQAPVQSSGAFTGPRYIPGRLLRN